MGQGSNQAESQGLLHQNSGLNLDPAAYVEAGDLRPVA